VKQPIILLVEDNYHLRWVLDMFLTQAGYKVITAADGEEALEQLKDTTAHLILSDINMPVMDGYDFYLALRADPVWELIPFIFITAKDNPQEIRFGKSLGVEDYVTKPFETADLLAVVEARLRRAHRIQEVTRHELDLVRSQIVKMLNHELRTPMSIIKGYVDAAIMEGSQLNAKTIAEYLKNISAGTERLSNLVEDLVQLVAIEGGVAATAYNHRKKCLDDLPVYIKGTAMAYVARAKQAGVKLKLEVPDRLPAVEGDVTFLADALGYLLDNAIKFSVSGGEVRVHAGTQDQMVTITIINQGKGIPSEELPYVFDVFHQVDREGVEQQGAGLGLAVAKGLVELHNGRIEVESEVGKNCIFTVFLPNCP
jgi:signal transduction histidine kinase